MLYFGDISKCIDQENRSTLYNIHNQIYKISLNVCFKQKRHEFFEIIFLNKV
jgi:hypothetical protein